MRTAGIGRMMKKVGGMLDGSGRGARPTGRRAARPRARSRTPAGGTGGSGGLGQLGRMAKRFLR